MIEPCWSIRAPIASLKSSIDTDETARFGGPFFLGLGVRLALADIPPARAGRGPSNQLGTSALFLMAKRKPPSIGPMSVQPVRHGSTALNQRPSVVIGSAKKRLPWKKLSKPDWKQSASQRQGLRGAILYGSSDKPRNASRCRSCLFNFCSRGLG